MITCLKVELNNFLKYIVFFERQLELYPPREIALSVAFILAICLVVHYFKCT